MRHQSPRTDNWLYDLCKDVHEAGDGVFGQGCADWPVGSLSDEYQALIQRAAMLGYITTEERMDFEERVVISLTASGRRLLDVHPEAERPSLIERLAAFFRR